MEPAGITDIRNAFAGIFQQAAGLEKPDAVQVSMTVLLVALRKRRHR